MPRSAVDETLESPAGAATVAATQGRRASRYLLPLVVLLGLVLVELPRLLRYAVRGDDFAVIQASRQFRPLDWLLTGFSDYFTVYPASTKPYTNFVRPGVNATVFVEHLLFGDHWGLYFLSTAVASAVGAWAGYSLVPHSRRNFLVVGATFVLAPSILVAFVSPVFGFDVVAMALVLAAISLLDRDRLLLAFALVLAAVFTKEIALVASASLAFYYLMVARQRRRAALFLLPLVAYAGVRLVGVGFGGTYATQGLTVVHALRNVLRAALVVPTGSFDGHPTQPLHQVAGSLLSLRLPAAGPSTQVLLFCANVVFVVLLLWNVPLFWRVLRRGPGLDALLLVVLAFTTGYVAVLGLGYRFYPLPLAVLLVVLLRHLPELRFSRSLLLVWVATIAVAVVPTLGVGQETGPGDASLFRSALAGRSGDRVLVVDAPAGFSAPGYVARFLGHSGEVAFLFSASFSCPSQGADAEQAQQYGGDVGGTMPDLQRRAGQLRLSFPSVSAQQCYRVSFPGIAPTLQNLVASPAGQFEVDGDLFVLKPGTDRAVAQDDSIPLTAIDHITVPGGYDRYVWIDYATGTIRSLSPQ